MKPLQMLSQQFNNNKLSYILLTTGFISLCVMLITQIIVNRIGVSLALIALIMFFVGIILRTCKPQNLNLKQKLFYWIPRIFVTLFGIFLSLLLMGGTMRSFRTPKLWETGLYIFICFMPAYFVLATLLFSRIWKWIGGLIFILIGLVIVILYRNQNSELGNYLLTALPIFIIGILFLLDWWYLPKLIPEQKIIE